MRIDDRRRPTDETDWLPGTQGVSKRSLAKRVMVNAILAIAAALVGVGSLILLLQHESVEFGPSRGGNFSGDLPGKGGNPPAYQFYWLAAAPSSYTAEQAYVTEGRVQGPGDGAYVSPVASLWVAQSADAALVIAQLDPQGQYLAVVPIERSGTGSSTVWQAAAGTWPTSQHCSGTSASPDGMCGESAVHSPAGNPFPTIWDWSASDGTVGVAAQFTEPLSAGPDGGTLAGLTLSVGSAQASNGGTIVAVGTASASALQQRAQQLAVTG